jgi:NTP pyrophosphatase (non-canonical NTP hydrolase)
VIDLDISELQKTLRKFHTERKWDEFPLSLVLVHLIEEVGELGKYILYKEGYKKKGLGHQTEPYDVNREIVQILFLLIQIANSFSTDLNATIQNELSIMATRFDKTEWRKYMDQRE